MTLEDRPEVVGACLELAEEVRCVGEDSWRDRGGHLHNKVPFDTIEGDSEFRGKSFLLVQSLAVEDGIQSEE